jgi:hypothetical protein
MTENRARPISARSLAERTRREASARFDASARQMFSKIELSMTGNRLCVCGNPNG